MAELNQDRTLATDQTTGKAKSVAVEPATQNEARKERQSKYITDKEALQLFRKLQEITGEKFPVITTSKSENLQLVESPAGNVLTKDLTTKYKPASFILYRNHYTEYHFDENGKYTHGGEWLEKLPKKAIYGIESQRLLREIKNYVNTHGRID